MHALVVAIGAIRAPLAVAVLSAAILLLPDQSREIFRAIREETGMQLHMELSRAVVMTFLLSFALLGSCLLLVAASSPSRAAATSLHRRLLEGLAVGIALVPPLVVGLSVVDLGDVRRAGPTWVELDQIVVAAAVALPAGIVAALLAFERLGAAVICSLQALYSPFARIGPVAGLALVAAIIAALNVTVVTTPAAIAGLLGPVGVTLLFLALTCVVASLLTYVYDRHQFPGLSLLAIGAAAFAMTGWSNNHHVRLLDNAAPAAPPVSAAFVEWLRQRADPRELQGRPFVVYVIAAEGGGLYAAAHAAWTLARLQDACPAFARHVFAISSVSGGSLGAAVFAALVKAEAGRAAGRERACSPAPALDGAMEGAVRDFFRKDLLTPLLLAGLFPDFTQRFLPRAIPQLDRARALEASYEEAWSKVANAHGMAAAAGLFGQNVRSMWSPGGDVPALMLNTTVVRSGDRLVVAPFTLSGASRFFRDLRIDDLNGMRVVRLSTAIGLSARFPIVTPPALLGTVWNGVQIVDGGFYENSGIQTAMDIVETIRTLEAQRREPPSAPAVGAPVAVTPCALSNTVGVDLGDAGRVTVCLKLIAISYPPQRQSAQPIADEIVAPLVGLFEARNARGGANNRMARQLYCGGEACGEGQGAVRPHVYVKSLVPEHLPLGWYLSEQSLGQVMSSVLDEPVDCFTPRASARDLMWQEFEDENNCILQRVARDLVWSGH